MMERSIFGQFKTMGRDMFLRGLISSHAGNMSVRVGDGIYITRRASMLGRLKESDIIELGIEQNDAHSLMASTELVVHRAIYKKTGALAIVHAHPPYATLLSMLEDELIPSDSEGSYFFKRVPVVSPKKTIGSEEAAGLVSELMKDYKIVLIKGHGSFARGDMLEEAFMLTTSLEASAFFLWHLRSGGKNCPKHSDKRKNR